MKGLEEYRNKIASKIDRKYENGKLIQQIAIFSDGRTIDQTYENDFCVKQTTTFADEKIEEKIFKEGTLVQKTTIFPLGNRIDQIYENKKLVQKTTTFIDEITIDKKYEDGKLVSVVVIYSNGDRIDESYENGKLVQEITTHSEGIQEKEIIGIESSQEKVSDHLPIFKGRIEHPRLSSELKVLFSAKQEKHQGLFYLINRFKDNGSKKNINSGFHTMVNFLNTQKKNENFVFEAFDNIENITLAPNNSQLRIISTGITGYWFLLVIQNKKIQILYNGGVGEKKIIEIEEKLQKKGTITVEKTNLKIDRDMKIEGRGDCALCAAAFMFKIFRMVEGLSYNDLVNPEFTTSKTPLDPKISFETIIQKLTDHTLNIHKVMANYALFYADKNQEEVNIDEKALNVYANDNNNLLMGCSINLLELSEQLKKQFSNQEKTPSTFRLAGGLTGLKKSF